MIRVLGDWKRHQPIIWWTFYVSPVVWQRFLQIIQKIPLYTGITAPESVEEKAYRFGVVADLQETLFSLVSHHLEQQSDLSEREIAELVSLLHEWKQGWNRLRTRRFIIRLPHATLELGERPLIMGILNVTPDSFYDGGRYYRVEQAVQRTLTMYQEGADIIDIGAQSTRPGSHELSPDEEWKRLEPVLKAIRPILPVPISVDTYYASVADRAVQAGADMINDVTAGTYDPDMLRVARYHGVPIVLMHYYERIRPMPKKPVYENVIRDIVAFLARRLEAAVEVGVSIEQTILDPGIGFGKKPEDNLNLIHHLSMMRVLGRPILFGPSRKSFMARAHEGGPEERLEGTLMACAWAWQAGAHIFRVHDIWPVRKGLSVWMAIHHKKYLNDMPWQRRSP